MSYPMENFISITSTGRGLEGPPPVDLGYENRDFDFTTGVLDPRLTFTRASTGTYFDSWGVLRTAPANTPRLDYDPATLTPRGLLVEGSATNLVLRSQEFDNAYWTKALCSVTPNAIIAPDGTITADKIIESSGTGNHIISRTIPILTSTTYTLSVFVKAAERTFALVQFGSFASQVASNAVYVNLITGDFSATDITRTRVQALPNGWFLVTTTVTTTASGVSISPSIYTSTGFGVSSYTGDGVSGIYCWGGQMEVGLSSSYIPTTTTTVTRAADVVALSIGSWYRPDQGTIIAKSLGGNGRVATVYGSPTQYVAINADGSGDIMGSTIGIPGGEPVGLAYMAGACAISAAGVITGNATSSALPYTPSNIYIGSLDGVSQSLNGWVQSLSYKPVRLGNGDLVNSTV